MTLEAVIQENTSAIRALIAAMAQGLPSMATPIAPIVTAPKAKKEKPQATLDKADIPAPATPSPAIDTPAAGATYDDVKSAIVKLSGLKGRDSVLDVLGQFDATKGPDLKPEQFADFITQANAAMAA